MVRMARATSGVQPYNVDTEQSLARLEALAKLMDSAFIVPGTNIRMGLDGIIGLVPVVGDLISGRYLELPDLGSAAARRLALGDLGRMIANTLIDTPFGAIPLVGDAFDVVFRTNVKNLALLRKHLRAGASSRRAPGPSSRARRSAWTDADAHLRHSRGLGEPAASGAAPRPAPWPPRPPR